MKSTTKRILTLATAIILVFSVALSASAAAPPYPCWFMSIAANGELDDPAPMGHGTIRDVSYFSSTDELVIFLQSEFVTVGGETYEGTIDVFEVYDEYDVASSVLLGGVAVIYNAYLAGYVRFTPTSVPYLKANIRIFMINIEDGSEGPHIALDGVYLKLPGLF
jgi:hypothetical protein